MPNRMLRDWTDSEAVNSLSAHAECFFVRLIMKADDFGRYYADPQLLKSYLFPRKDIRTADIARWVAECETSGLIACYVGADGHTYAAIRKFDQRMRAKKSRFPEPTGKHPEDKGKTDDSHMTVTCQTNDGHVTARDERREDNTHTARARVKPYPQTKEEVKRAAEAICYAMSDEEAEKFLADGRATGWRWRGQMIEDWTQILIRWKLAKRNVLTNRGATNGSNTKQITTDEQDFDTSKNGTGF